MQVNGQTPNQHQQNSNQTQGMQADAQKVVDHLGAQIGQLTVENASLKAVLADKDEHIEQLQKMLRERHEPPTPDDRVTAPVDGSVLADTNGARS